VELGAADLAAADHINAFDERRVDREYALDAFAVGNLANGEAFAETAARTGDADAFIGLYAGTAAFANADVHANGVAGGEFRQLALGFDLGGLFGFQFLDDVHRSNLYVFLKQPERSIAILRSSLGWLPLSGQERVRHSLLAGRRGNPISGWANTPKIPVCHPVMARFSGLGANAPD